MEFSIDELILLHSIVDRYIDSYIVSGIDPENGYELITVCNKLLDLINMEVE